MRRTWVKCVCAVLCVLLLVAGGLSSIFAVSWYVDTHGVTFYESGLCWRVTNGNLERVEAGIDILADQSGENLSAYAQQQLQEITQSLDPDKSNFRYRCTASDGTVVLTNVEGEAWRESVYRVSAPREYGVYVYDETGGRWETYTVECGVAAPLRVDDAYATAKEQFDWLTNSKAAVISACVGCIAAGVILLILLIAAAGRRVGREEVVLNVQDRIPYDLYLAIAVFLGLLFCALWLEGTYYFDRSEPELGIAWVAAASLALVVLALALLLTTATRIKAHVLLHNTLIARICRVIKRGVTRAYRSLPMTGRAVLLFLAYLLGTALTSATIVLAPIYQGCVLYLICRWVLQWKRIRAATQDIVSGKPDTKIEAEKYYPDLKEHAGQLNDLGSAIDHAVDERMKSERFKAELITNVSHDLKTPLTSIINYVDLLKKEDIPNPVAQEYIDVLDRKSQRLKKLTEDLVEASKASTGALAVNKERLDVVQLIRQATGEYEEKLTAAGLALMLRLPETPVYIDADGRHVWRVLDNLLGNCAKYALEGTRVYLDAVVWDGNAIITVKNVSRQPLNIPAEQLVERFVRGDESRTTEGSGLGLSIARSLTELQGGRFSLDIDGDLFKAKVMFPLAQE